MNQDFIDLKLPLSVEYKEGELYLLDQTLLPLEIKIEKQESAAQVFDSIKKLKVRGAPAIGIAGAYGLLVAIKPHLTKGTVEFLKALQKEADYLNSSRPTAVNLSWGLKKMTALAHSLKEKDPKEIFSKLEKLAIEIHEEDIACCQSIGRHGEPLIKEGMGLLTHCNAGHLAVSQLGTALAPIYTAKMAGKIFKVYADETRPLLQGARLTAWELQEGGVDVTLICDNMAGHLMSLGKIDMVIVGTDRVAANGDVANKIGTFSVAVLAQYHKIPFYVACPYSTIDLETPTGADIVIEQRHSEEVTNFGARQTGPTGIQVENPAFDITPANLVTGIITEKGIFTAPFGETLRKAVLG
ncbi:MAG: S-methyl-5-thioribose-1-phosphate isomerase [SAR324 cluster bacterium]|nr:S-methyl-5-thioribose-1-phosphate isomerase [SAR324 cluster bacterium]